VHGGNERLSGTWARFIRRGSDLSGVYDISLREASSREGTVLATTSNEAIVPRQ
jgi:hypothetical protein